MDDLQSVHLGHDYWLCFHVHFSDLPEYFLPDDGLQFPDAHARGQLANASDQGANDLDDAVLLAHLP